jgi:hydrogenase nickel incorporation protein HypA/HybF
MHEMSLIHDLVHKIDSIAKEQNAQKVTQVNVRLGALSHISAEHFKDHFVEGAKGTVAEGARLETEVSQDIGDPQAQDIILLSVEVEEQ